MADVPVPSLSELVELSVPVGNLSSTSKSQAGMTQRSDSSEEEIRKPLQTGSSGSAHGKKKRTQFSSCDACRLRKVRCIREHEQLECNSCISKNIACTRVFSQAHAHGKGKRITQARDQFGTKSEVDDTQSSSSSSSTSPPMVVQTIATSRMNEHVLSAKALGAFLHAYEVDVAVAIPALEYGRLLQVCKHVDFDINRLDELDRVLCIAAAAVAASIQQADRKFGIGQCAIVIKEPLAMKKDLEIRVMAEADRLGILRKPSARALETLRLFCILTSGDGSPQLRRSDSYRAYEQALVEHLRSLSESGQISEEKVAEYFWSIILGDSFAAALSGRSPSFTQDDIENFASFVDYSTEGMLSIISQLEHISPHAGFGLIFANICQMCRNFYARITSKRARRRPFVDVEMLQDIPPEVDRINGVLEACEQKLDSMFGKDGWPEPLPYWGKIVRFLHIFVMVMALDELEAAIIKELSGNVSSQRLYILQQTLERLQLRTMEELKAKVGWQPKPGSARILATIDGLMAFFSVLRMRRIFKLPSLEEGGCRGSWTMEEKLINAQYYMKVCEYLGCALAEIGAELPTLRSEMRTLEQKAKNLSEQQRDTSRLNPGMSDGANGFSMRAMPYPGVPKFSEEANACRSQTWPSVEMINTQLELPNVHFGNRFTEVTRAEPVCTTETGTNFGAFETFDPLNNPPPVLDETFSSWTTLLPPSDPCHANTLSPDAQFEQFLTNLE